MNLYNQLLKNDLSSFIGKTLLSCDPDAPYLPNWHIDLIAEHLEAARNGTLKRLIINMPPRSLKSICVSVAWPAWLLGHNPKSRIIAASYSSVLATKHSIDCRQVIQSPWYRQLFPEVELAYDQNEKSKFMTKQRGFRMATSVGGSLTGEGGNYLILDDPINPMQATSPLHRKLVNQWFDHTFASRLNDKRKGVIVLVMQRLHQDDLTGYLLEKGGWQHLCLPMVANEREVHDFGDIYKVREAGEFLHMGRENTETIERTKRELGSMAFAAQFQQQPVPEEGNMIRAWWFGRYKTLPLNVMRKVQSWDTAIKSGVRNDASVCLTFYEHEGHSYLLDAAVMRCGYPDLKKAVCNLYARWKPDALLIEDKASGQQLIQDLRREGEIPVIGLMPKNDKVTRFAAVSAMIEAGRLLLPEEAPWLAAFEDELLRFPNATHDDQVDALTQYLDWLRMGILEKLRVRTL